MITVTLKDHIEGLEIEYGSLSEAARVLGIDKAYLSRLKNGHAKNPNEVTLEALGLGKVVCYVLQ